MANELTCAYEVNQKYHNTRRESGKTFLTYSLARQVFGFFQQIDDDWRFDQELRTEKTEPVGYYPVSHNDSEIHAEQNGNLERHEISKVEGRVQCQRCQRNQRPGGTLCGCSRMLQGIAEEVMMQAEQRISSRHIKYVTGTNDLALKNTQKGPTLWKICFPQKLDKPRDYLESIPEEKKPPKQTTTSKEHKLQRKTT